MAFNRYFKQDGVRHSEVSYFDVEVWFKVAKSCEKYLNKGRGVRIVERLKQDRWTDDQGEKTVMLFPFFRVPLLKSVIDIGNTAISKLIPYIR